MKPEETKLFISLDKVTKVTFGIHVDGDLTETEVKATLKFPLTGNTTFSVDGLITSSMEIEFLVPELDDIICEGDGEYILELRVGDVVYEPFKGPVVFEKGDIYDDILADDDEDEEECECEECEAEYDIYDDLRKHKDDKEYLIETYKTKVLGLSKEIPVVEEAILAEIEDLLKGK